MADRDTAEPRRALAEMLARCRVESGHGFDLATFDPAEPPPNGLAKPDADALIAAGVTTLSGLQERLYANATWALLVIMQAMDAAGKDGTIKHVMSGVNPQGVTVTAFKAPGPEDLAHDFLWRPTRALPARGMIGIFNRSHYEDVLVPRVEPSALVRQHLPERLAASPRLWDRRLQDIAGFERHLVHEGTAVIKLFLNVSLAEQGRRLRARLDEPEKLWKFDPADLAARAKWDAYRDAYAAAIAATATPETPWFVIPADRKWLTRLLVMEAITQTLGTLELASPQPDAATLDAIAKARQQLDAGR